jgi:hypothetical protein
MRASVVLSNTLFISVRTRLSCSNGDLQEHQIYIDRRSFTRWRFSLAREEMPQKENRRTREMALQHPI